MGRLPEPGGDKGTWGTVLNDFLNVAHNPDGSLKPIENGVISDAAITVSKIAAATPTTGQVLSYTGSTLQWATPTDGTIIPDAANDTKGIVQLAGDIEGTASSLLVTGIRGQAITTTTPTNDQVLSFNSSTARWEPRPRGKLPEGWISVKDFGAVGDGSTDDTAAIQNAVNSINPLNNAGGGGVAGSTLYFPPGEYRITATVDFHRFAGTIMGNGVGNSPLYPSGRGHASIIKWGGAAGQSMFKVSDSRNITFSKLRFFGNNSSPPLAGIEFYAPSPGDPEPHNSNGSGTNEFIVVEDCYFGVYTWNQGGLHLGELTNGILIQDPDGNGNNDQFFFSRNQFCGRTTGQLALSGIKITSTQSIWGSIQNCFFNALGAGLDTVASITTFNSQFNRCITDIIVRSTAQVYTMGHWSENSGQVVRITSGGGAYDVRGGKWVLQPAGWDLNQANSLGGYYIQAMNLGLGGRLKIDSIQITVSAGYSVTENWMAYIRSTGSSGSHPGRFEMINCVGIGDTTNGTPGDSTMVANLTRFDMAAHISSAGVQVDIDNPMLRYKRWLRSGAVNGTTPLVQQENVATGFFGVTPIGRPNLTYSRTGEHASTAAIRQALTALGLVSDNTTT